MHETHILLFRTASLPTLTTTSRITLSLVCLATSVMALGHTVGLFPDAAAGALRGRTQLCESIAVMFSLLAERGDSVAMNAGLTAIAERNSEIESLAIRRESGELTIEVGEHELHWNTQLDGNATETQMYVPIVAHEERWGTVEVRFAPITAGGWYGALRSPLMVFIVPVSIVLLIVFQFYLGRVLRHLDPSRVVPGRVRKALNTLSEGLLILDDKGRIVLANNSFLTSVGHVERDLLGLEPGQLGWEKVNEDDYRSRPVGGDDQTLPWSRAASQNAAEPSTLLQFSREAGDRKTFFVNSSPIQDDNGSTCGVLTSFKDVTSLQQKKRELKRTVEQLRASSDEISRQNRELELLATRDPLTGCLNRRAFFEQFATLWRAATRYGQPLSAIMVDIDRFKSINDMHGHAAGDEVLRSVGAALREAGRETDLLCRYGGEEFALVLPHTSLEHAELAAEKFRVLLAGLQLEHVSVTASFGVSETCLKSETPQELLDQADKALLLAKRTGRNRVLRFGEGAQMLKELPGREDDPAVRESVQQPVSVSSIPFHAVTALISALAYRDPATAAHSRRVADLCVTASEGLVSLSDCYVIEIAALLHDIGKIGVPDSILLKPGPLTPEEWEVMRQHDQIGIELVQASFASPQLTEIVHFHHSANPTKSGRRPPLGARVLAIADAYDSMVSEQRYRKGCTQAEAFAELRRCAGTQFDEELVERFISTVSIHLRDNDELAETVSKETALSIGTQIERLAAVLDDQDMESLKAVARRLHQTATSHGAARIARKASTLDNAINSHPDLMGIMQSANELLDLCRSTQNALLEPRSKPCDVVEVGVSDL